MGEKKSLRIMTINDLGEVLVIENACYSTPWSSQQFVDELNNGVATILLCELDGEIAGYICYWLITGEMQILNIAVAPHARRNGVAERLLQQAFSDCLLRGLTSAWLEVRIGNCGAVNLYERNGFQRTGLRRGYYRDGEDAVLMVREFNKRSGEV
jgi:ribosomal-protein-alanine N-acetyltransferase